MARRLALVELGGWSSWAAGRVGRRWSSGAQFLAQQLSRFADADLLPYRHNVDHVVALVLCEGAAALLA